MTDPMHQQLLGHLLGALDDDEHERVDALLESDPRYGDALLAWRRRIAPLEALRPEFEPPPDLARRTALFVASQAPGLTASDDFKPRMTARQVPPGSMAPFCWLDVAAVTFFLLLAILLGSSAIDGSRFHARLASCQDGLRRIGVALNLYGDQQQEPLGHLARNGRLTSAGMIVADRIRAGYYSDPCRPACPEAWLAVQGAFVDKKDLDAVLLPQSMAAARVPDAQFALQANWPGTRRDGTTQGRPDAPVPADVPLLADAPSADLPGLAPAVHRGRGKNIYYADGHAAFWPATPSRDPRHLLWLDTETDSAGNSMPIIYVHRSTSGFDR